MSAYNFPDYRERFFEYKNLTKVHGQPTIDSIVLLYDQVKVNAQKVQTTLGGDQWGYLAIAVTTPVYRVIPGTVPFIRPTHSGVFTPVATTAPVVTGVATRAGAAAGAAVPAPTLTSGAIATQKNAYDERLRLYNEFQSVEDLLRTQIIDAIDHVYPNSHKRCHYYFDYQIYS